MEILALLLLGFIAMLAIVPPIIRGKLEESPLVTTQTFQKSMQEIAHSLEPRLDSSPAPRGSRASDVSAPKGRAYRVRGHGGPSQGAVSGTRIRSKAAPTPSGSRAGVRRSPSGRAAIRRNRILASLTLLAFGWGLATLFTGSLLCLLMFSATGFLLALYWGLTIIVPYLPMRGTEAKRQYPWARGTRSRDIA